MGWLACNKCFILSLSFYVICLILKILKINWNLLISDVIGKIFWSHDVSVFFKNQTGGLPVKDWSTSNPDHLLPLLKSFLLCLSRMAMPRVSLSPADAFLLTFIPRVASLNMYFPFWSVRLDWVLLLAGIWNLILSGAGWVWTVPYAPNPRGRDMCEGSSLLFF